MEERIKELEAENEQLKADKEVLIKQMEVYKKDNESAKEDIDKLETEIENLNNIIKNANTEFNTKLANQRNDYEQLLQERDKLISELMQGSTATDTTSFIDKINKKRIYHSYD